MQMPTLSLTKVVSTLFCSLALVACGPPDEADRVKNPGPAKGAFLVSDYFTASGDMGDGEIFGQLLTDFNVNCAPRPVGALGDCYRFTYRPTTKYRWAGVYWQYPANSWGAYPGRALEGPIDLGGGKRGYTQVRFSMAADSDRFVDIVIGGIDGDSAIGQKLPYSDVVADDECVAGGQGALTNGQDHVCRQFKIKTGFDVTTTMKEYTVSLANTPLTAVIGAFAWASNYPTSEDVTTAKPTIIYVDNIVWE